MTPSKHLQTLGSMPWGGYVTTYRSDYKPFSERQPQVGQLKPRTEARAAPAFISTPQTDRETWPIFNQYSYKTTNSTYGSYWCSQPPSSSLCPDSFSPFGVLAPSIYEPSVGVADSALTEDRAEEVRVARETGPLLGKEEKGQLCNVFGGNDNVWEQQEAKDEPQQKFDILYEEGVIVVSSHLVGPGCCRDLLRSVCGEAGRQDLLHLPVASSPIISMKDAENWAASAYFGGLGPAIGLNNSAFHHPTSRQCWCCAWGTEYPNSWCFKMQIPPGVPPGSTVPLANVQPTVYRTELSRKPLLTEYQASYTAEWAQPKV